MSNDIISIKDLNTETYQINSVDEEAPSVNPADHILLVKLTEADRNALLALFESKESAALQYEEFNNKIDDILNGKLSEENINTLKNIFMTNEHSNETYATKIALSHVINNVGETSQEVGRIKISLSSIINKTELLDERVNILEEKLSEANVTLSSINW